MNMKINCKKIVKCKSIHSFHSFTSLSYNWDNKFNCIADNNKLYNGISNWGRYDL